MLDFGKVDTTNASFQDGGIDYDNGLSLSCDGKRHTLLKCKPHVVLMSWTHTLPSRRILALTPSS